MSRIHCNKNGRAACVKGFAFLTQEMRDYKVVKEEKFRLYIEGKSENAKPKDCCKKCARMMYAWQDKSED